MFFKLASLWAQSPQIVSACLVRFLADRFHVRTDIGDEHILDLFRAAHRAGMPFRFRGGFLELSLPVEGQTTQFQLRLDDSDVRVVRELIVHDEYRAIRSIDPAHCLRIIDAGANVGISGLLLRRRFPKASIICLEPDPKNAARAQHHFGTNGLADIRTLTAALWPEDGTVALSTPADDSKSWAIQARASASGNVRAISVPSLLKESGWDEIDLLKLDIEGGEFGLLKAPPARFWLPRIRTIIGEYHPPLGDVEEFFGILESAGFTTERVGLNLFSASRHANAVPK